MKKGVSLYVASLFVSAAVLFLLFPSIVYAPVPDEDLDYVPDGSDDCPGSGTIDVDTHGCSCAQTFNCPPACGTSATAADSDGDGVLNSADLCPGSGTTHDNVNDQGCSCAQTGNCPPACGTTNEGAGAGTTPSITATVSGSTVTAVYANLPSNSYIMLINNSNQGDVENTILGISNSITHPITISSNVPPGTYFLRVNQSVAGTDLTVANSATFMVGTTVSVATTPDTTAPTSDSTALNNSAPRINEAVNPSGRFTDGVSLSSIWLAHNMSTWRNATSINFTGAVLTGNFSPNITNTLAGGSVVGLVFTANDTSGNSRQSAVFTYSVAAQYVAANTATSFTLANNNTDANINEFVQLSSLVNDADTLSIVLLSWNCSSSGAWINVSNATANAAAINYTVNLSVGRARGNTCGWLFYSNDSAGNGFTASAVNAFSIGDSTAPALAVSLNDTSLNQNDGVNISANISDNEGLSMCQIISNQTGASQYFNVSLSGTSSRCSRAFTISAGDRGVVNFTVRVNDTSNLFSQSSAIVVIADANPPSISLVSISKKIMGAAETNIFSFRCEDGESFLDSMNFTMGFNRTSQNLTRSIQLSDRKSYIWNYTLFQTSETQKEGYWNITGVGCSDGPLNYRSNDSSTMVGMDFLIDAPPVINAKRPGSGSTLKSSAGVIFNATITENHPASMLLYINGVLNQTKSYNGDGSSVNSFDGVNLADLTSYKYSISANNSFGSWTNSSNVSFKVNTTSYSGSAGVAQNAAQTGTSSSSTTTAGTTGQTGTSTSPTTIIGITPQTGTNTQSVTTIGTTAQPGTSAPPAESAGTADEDSGSFLVWILYLMVPLVLISAAFAVVKLRKKGSKKSPGLSYPPATIYRPNEQKMPNVTDYLKGYVNANLKRGSTKGQIRDALLKSGYNNQDIEESFRMLPQQQKMGNIPGLGNYAAPVSKEHPKRDSRTVSLKRKHRKEEAKKGREEIEKAFR